mmetsp:Transcript_14990/g.16227  ORF Transcript_14990/g.16227 Transcript_14990/m.16227 type:complete len:148 (-) Transcript_14990:86-529(-)|eukprot:CAMPEP_0173143902 /NCGR_PEP_ID=MMETSP1105-20130129/6930_1 /TAXON_ID=2985 /ORGANISM="Ochromonas sp., Strain BG-1" /LENGTH=147 /DNA_ID=CAMNT_0014057513 /DNA_START=64 /DNA_END=507 /DNA_ORIENTATION=+
MKWPSLRRVSNEVLELKDGSYLISFSLGDGGDGHGQSAVIGIKSNLSPDDVMNSYKEGVQELGFDITIYCQDYEDCHIPDNFIDALEAKGFEAVEFPGWSNEYPDSVNPAEFTQIFLFTVKLGNPSFTYSRVNISTFDLGGYGLFFS